MISFDFFESNPSKLYGGADDIVLMRAGPSAGHEASGRASRGAKASMAEGPALELPQWLA